MNSSNRKIELVNLVLVFTSIAFALLASEGILRISKLPLVGIAHQPCVYQEDDKLGYQYKPSETGWIHRNFEMDNIVQINSTGFHDIDHKIRDNERLRIAAIGDSFTAALHVSTSEGWTQTLQRELRILDYSSADVINLGLDGTGTDVHLAILKEYLQNSRPRIVILAFHESDFVDISHGRLFRECYKGYVLSFQNKDQREQLRAIANMPRSQSVSQWLFDNIYLYRAIIYLSKSENNILRNNFLQLSSIDFAITNTADSKANIDNIFQEFIDLSMQYKFELLIIPIPGKNGNSGLDVLRKDVSERKLAELNAIDISPIIERLLLEENKSYKKMYWLYDSHFNVFGNHIFGLAVAESIHNYLQTSLTER